MTRGFSRRGIRDASNGVQINTSTLDVEACWKKVMFNSPSENIDLARNIFVMFNSPVEILEDIVSNHLGTCNLVGSNGFGILCMQETLDMINQVAGFQLGSVGRFS
nr:hypothetical protein [Tanacetum cinerariifolium]